MGLLSKAKSTLFGSTGPKYSAQAGAAQNSGDTYSDLGNIIRTANADGSIDTKYESSEIDKLRNSLAQSGLSGLSLDGSDASKAYYDQATSYLRDDYNDAVDKTDERLINRGIQTGTKQYNDTMNSLADAYNQQLGNIANQSVYMGTQNVGNQISNINALTGARDINTLAGLNLQNSDAYDNAYQGKVYNDAMRNQRNSNMLSTAGAIAGGAFAFSDKRLKENLKPVGKLHNGLKVYVGNYKKETGLDTTPQLFLLAQDVQKKHPEAVTKKMGALAVDYKQATKKGE